MVAHGIDLQTPLQDNMSDTRPKGAARQLCKVRNSIETALSILTEGFALAKIKAHDLWHFTSKLYRKIFAYNFYVMIKS